MKDSYCIAYFCLKLVQTAPSIYFLNNEQFIIIHSTGSRTLNDSYNNIVEFGGSSVALKLFD
jgi:hypothetical protein